MRYLGRVIAVVATLSLIFSSIAEAGEEEDALAKMADLLGRSLAQRELQWTCVPARGEVCGLEGCTSIKPSVYVVLDIAEKTYSRCDRKGCDKYPMIFSSAGLFSTFSLPGSPTTFLKVLNDGTVYVEVASKEFDIYQNFGTCTPGKK